MKPASRGLLCHYRATMQARRARAWRAILRGPVAVQTYGLRIVARGLAY